MAPLESQDDRVYTPVVGLGGGIDQSVDPYFIEPGFAAAASNLVFVFGHAELRKGLKEFGGFSSGVPSGDRGSIWSGLVEVLFEDGTRYLLTANASKIYRYDGSNWVDVTGTDLATGSNGDPWNHAFGIDSDGLGGTGTLVFTNGTNDVLVFNPSADATAFHSIRTPPTGTYSGGPSAKLGARYAAVFNGRLVLGYTVENTGGADAYHTTRTRFSRVNNFLEWDVTNGALTVDHADSPGHITGLVEHRGALYVLKRDSIIVGQETGDPSSPLAFPTSFSTGVLEGRTFVHARPDLAFFLGEDDVYAIESGAPQGVGERIRQDLFSRLNFDALRLAHAYVDPTLSLYRLFVPVDGTNDVRRCYTFNWVRGTWGIEDYPTHVYAVSNSIVRGVTTIGDLTGTLGSYDNPIGDWGQSTGPPVGVFSTRWGSGDYRIHEPSTNYQDDSSTPSDVVTSWESGDVELAEGHVTTVRQVQLFYDAKGSVSFSVGVSTDRGATWTSVSRVGAYGDGVRETFNFQGVAVERHRVRVQMSRGDAKSNLAEVKLRAVGVAHTPGREVR